MGGIAALFPSSYEESRARFRQNLARVSALWPDARLAGHPLDGDETLTIDWLQAAASERIERLFILTTGEHGIEGTVGSAMLQLFVEEVLGQLDPRNTGLLLVHAINPWGMKHERRTNRANVDLNRNFFWDDRVWDKPPVNPDRTRLEALLQSQGPIGSLFWNNLSLDLGLLWAAISLGPRRVMRAVTLGQYHFPRGIYYGGDGFQEETQVLMGLYRSAIREYERVVLLDIHTGYGPRYQMSVVNSALEARDSRELAARFGYPLVVKTDAHEFFSIQGDMIDYVYTLVRNEFPGKRLYAASFEFGTIGAVPLRAPRIMLSENRLYWLGAKDERVRERIMRDFRELFNPQAERWRAKAVADARQAFEGILRAEQFLY